VADKETGGSMSLLGLSCPTRQHRLNARFTGAYGLWRSFWPSTPEMTWYTLDCYGLERPASTEAMSKNSELEPTSLCAVAFIGTFTLAVGYIQYTICRSTCFGSCAMSLFVRVLTIASQPRLFLT
jgi:hypothetical protein